MFDADPSPGGADALRQAMQRSFRPAEVEFAGLQLDFEQPDKVAS